jgi:ubiquinone/menaquinone biosynthesis C-methylase UbiE
MIANRPSSHHHQHGRPGHGPATENESDLAELLELDAVYAAPFLRDALEVAETALGRKPRHIVDLGAGTGTGTVALARRFAEARVHALDASASMLERVRASSIEAGVPTRVETHLVDLDADWLSDLAVSVDLAWAALSLHHMTDAAQVLKQTFDLLRPGGVVVVSELTGESSYSPADLGTGRHALTEHLIQALTIRGYPVTSDWSEALTAAGFDPVQRQEAAISVSSSAADGARFLELQLTRSRQLLTETLDHGDLAALDSALASLASGPTTDSHLQYTSGRAFWVAVRPGVDVGGASAVGEDR